MCSRLSCTDDRCRVNGRSAAGGCQKTYRDKVDFVHIEVWKNFDKQQLNDTAAEWLLRADGGLSEPYVYVIDSKGTIYDRWEGPVAANIMEPIVKAVSEGKTYTK